VDLGAKFAPKITEGEWWRFFTPMFMHVGLGHIFMNMLMQVRVGRSLEQSYGAFRIAPIYLACGIFGNLLRQYFYQHKFKLEHQDHFLDLWEFYLVI